VVFLRSSAGVEEAAAVLSQGIRAAVERVRASHGAAVIEDLDLLPISLGRPLDGLGQAVVLTGAVFHVNDVRAWDKVRRLGQPWWRRLF
jgi:hypothetical protein